MPVVSSLPVPDGSGHHDRDVVATEQGLGADRASVRRGAALDEGPAVHHRGLVVGVLERFSDGHGLARAPPVLRLRQLEPDVLVGHGGPTFRQAQRRWWGWMMRVGVDGWDGRRKACGVV